MPELRKDPVTRRWVIISGQKGPDDYPPRPVPPTRPVDCPFCYGAEQTTPLEIVAYRDGLAVSNAPGWNVRVVPNKFPALRHEGALKRSGEGLYDRMTGIGAHEVIIETPDHDATLGQIDQGQLERVLEVYQDRALNLSRDPRFKYILIFKNYGRMAGASLEHAHSQLIATPVIPKRVQEELTGAERYFQYKERCVYCDVMHQELETGDRICFEGEHFLALAPFASRFPFELMILPREHQPDFPGISVEQIRDLARVVKEVCSRLERTLGTPPYNYMLHTAPLQHRAHDYYHWHIELIPRLTELAGFEWGSGFYINPTSPEDAVEFLLRDVEQARTGKSDD